MYLNLEAFFFPKNITPDNTKILFLFLKRSMEHNKAIDGILYGQFFNPTYQNAHSYFHFYSAIPQIFFQNHIYNNLVL